MFSSFFLLLFHVATLLRRRNPLCPLRWDSRGRGREKNVFSPARPRPSACHDRRSRIRGEREGERGGPNVVAGKRDTDCSARRSRFRSYLLARARPRAAGCRGARPLRSSSTPRRPLTAAAAATPVRGVRSRESELRDLGNRGITVTKRSSFA